MLRPPARYTPFINGSYNVRPNLNPFPTVFGNGNADDCHFQFDEDFSRYRLEKLQRREEDFGKYVPECHELPPAVLTGVNQFIANRLVVEHPEFFAMDVQGLMTTLRCQLTNEVLQFDERFELQDDGSIMCDMPKYRDTFDALACQLQEDIAIWYANRVADTEWLGALHLCFPNHWSAEEKIGKSFMAVHEPVPGFPINAAVSAKMVQTMISKGPFVRFAWGIATDTELNHHPQIIQGRLFNPSDPKLFVRIERQTIVPFMDLSAALFTIRTSFLDINSLSSFERLQLVAALQSMSAAQLKYKGLEQNLHEILMHLTNKDVDETSL